MKHSLGTSSIFSITLIILFLFITAGTSAMAATTFVYNLQPSWTASGGGGVYSAYYGPSDYLAVSPGATALYDSREAGIIKAGLVPVPGNIDTWDEGLFGFRLTVTIDVFAAGTLTYDVENQYGENPVWITIDIDTGVVGDRSDDTVYQFLPITNPTGWHTVDAAAGQWQKWNDGNGDTTGNPLISLSQVAIDNTGLNVVRAYLRLGMGDSYHGTAGLGTVAWVDKVTIGEVIYDFVVAVTTKAATDVTKTDATLNGVNGNIAAAGHSFWVSLSTFDTTSSTIPTGVYSTVDLGAIAANTAFSAPLTSVTGLPAVTPNTKYYFAAWSLVDGTWYPGEILDFTTAAPAPNLILTAAPTSETIAKSALVPTTGTQSEINTAVNAAIIGLTPIKITLANTGDAASANVRISPINAGSHIQLWAKDSTDNWFDINAVGWIDAAGISVPASYSATTDVYAISDAAGSYPLTANLILVSDLSVVASTSGTVNVVAPILVYNLQPSWTAIGGGGVYSAYYGPSDYLAVSPGATALYDGREAGIIKAGLSKDPIDLIYEDQGLFAFKPGDTPIATFATQTFTYDFVNQYGVNPVWVYIELNKGIAGDIMYQYVPTSNPLSWHTEDAASGTHWQAWTDLYSGVPTGPMLSLTDIAAANPGKTVSRVYLTEGMGDSYYNSGTGTVAWVDKVTLGGVIYDFVLPFVTTKAATDVTSTDATLNGVNGNIDAAGHSFWVSLSTFDTTSPTIPAGVYSTVDLGAIAANTAFSAPLTSVTGLPAVTPNTKYYFAAWSQIGGTWYPGEILDFTTAAGCDTWVSKAYNATSAGNHSFGYDAFSTIQEGINAAGSGCTVYVAPGIYPEIGQILINKNLRLFCDEYNKPIIKPTDNTGNSGDARGWLVVDSEITFDLKNCIFDGSGYKIYQAIRHKGTGTISNCEFKNIAYEESGPAYSGFGIAAFGNDVNITNSVFSNIGRVGVLYFGDGITNSVYSNNSYTGKGIGNWLDYGVEIGAGAKVTIVNNSISNNKGVASVDGSTSAGILVTTFYGIGTEAKIENNTITNCYEGIAVGYDHEDMSTLTIINNIISNNEHGIDIISGTGTFIAYENIFLNNTIHAIDDSAASSWDNGIIGNYWDTFKGYDANTDGISETTRLIDGAAVAHDMHPLISSSTANPMPAYTNLNPFNIYYTENSRLLFYPWQQTRNIELWYKFGIAGTWTLYSSTISPIGSVFNSSPILFLAPNGDGQYFFIMRTIGSGTFDYNGELAPITATEAEASTILDTQAPVDPVFPSNNMRVGTLRPNITVTFYDITSGVNISGVRLFVNGTNRTSESIITSTKLVLIPAFDFNEGNNELKVIIPDNAGNTVTRTWNVIVASKPIEINIIKPVEGMVYNKSEILTNITLNRDVDVFEYMINSVRINLCNNCNNISKNITFPEGQITLTVYGRDSFTGFRSNKSIHFTVDSKIPKITSVSPEDKSVFNKKNVKFSVAFEEKNLDKVVLHLNHGENGHSEEQTFNLTSCTSFCTKTLNLGADDFYTFYFEVIGKKYNSTSERRRILVDSTPAFTTISIEGTKNANGWYKTSPTITLTANETDAVVYLLKASSYMKYTEPFTVFQYHNIVQFYSIDRAGNREKMNKSEDIKVDDIAPKIKSVSPEGNTILKSASAVIKATYDDFTSSASGIDKDSVKIFVNNTDKTGDAKISTSQLSLNAVLAEGNNEIKVIVADNAGNIAEKRWNITINTKAPIVKIIKPLNLLVSSNNLIETGINADTPSKISLNLRIGGSNFPASICKNCVGYLENRSYPDGLIELTATATDQFGRTGSDTVKFTVDAKPLITAVTPADNLAMRTGTVTFSVKYSEESLQNAVFYYKYSNETVWTSRALTCPKGKAKSCQTNVAIPLTYKNKGLTLSYYFELKDTLSTVPSATQTIRIQ